MGTKVGLLSEVSHTLVSLRKRGRSVGMERLASSEMKLFILQEIL